MLQQTKRKYFEIWGDTQSQNTFLKGLLLLTIIINITLLITVTSLALKKPLLISANKNQTLIIKSSDITNKQFIKNEITNSVKKFVTLRHNWDWKNIDKNIISASQFIDSSFQSKFIKSNKPQFALAKKKKISQRFYLSTSVKVNLKTNTVLITGDRILIVDGLRATQPMSFKLQYQFGSRTAKNPEGVYIKSETLVSSLTH